MYKKKKKKGKVNLKSMKSYTMYNEEYRNRMKPMSAKNKSFNFKANVTLCAIILLHIVHNYSCKGITKFEG
jgi:hypothetical protein